MAWATTADVTAMTGEVVTETDVTLASAMIDTVSGASEDMPTDAITPRDRTILKRATIWQAVWISGKPGLLREREATTSSSGDGQSITRGAPSDVYLAPLASRELRNLSWIGTRTVGTAGRPALPPALDFLNERSDPL
ncbi:MAG TPA: hypothetical protein VFU47_12895 [Armatimonadota bacterium]|nr:hypothetical protein [Armatimonadota bacterium]